MQVDFGQELDGLRLNSLRVTAAVGESRRKLRERIIGRLERAKEKGEGSALSPVLQNPAFLPTLSLTSHQFESIFELCHENALARKQSLLSQLPDHLCTALGNSLSEQLESQSIKGSTSRVSTGLRMAKAREGTASRITSRLTTAKANEPKTRETKTNMQLQRLGLINMAIREEERACKRTEQENRRLVRAAAYLSRVKDRNCV